MVISQNYGKFSVIARNSVNSRRFGGQLDLFTAGLWTWTQKPNQELGFLDSVEIKRSFEGLRTDFDKLALASFLAELIIKISPEHLNQTELFKLYANALAAIEESHSSGATTTHEIQWVLAAFLAKFLQINGVQPQIAKCLDCDTMLSSELVTKNLSQPLRFLTHRAGWLCPNCIVLHDRTPFADEQPLTSFDITALAGITEVPLKELKTLLEFLNQGKPETLIDLLLKVLFYHIPGADSSQFKSLGLIQKS